MKAETEILQPSISEVFPVPPYDMKILNFRHVFEARAEDLKIIIR